MQARVDQGSDATLFITIGTLLAAAEIILFGWNPGKTVAGAALGTGLWGLGTYLTSTANLVPRGELQEAPAGIEIEPGGVDLSSRFWLIALAAVCLPLAWVADRVHVGAAFVPGQLYGWAAASLIGLIRIRRWERAHGRRVVYDPDADTPRPYAGPAL
jgi:hypothetical protein